jgi:hypothetical protein
MNESAKEELQRILDLGPDSINESELAFLQARRSYLSDEQRINFGITDEAVKEQSSEDSEAPARRSRKASSDEATK